MTCYALISVRPQGGGKTRLASILEPERRKALVYAMAAHVLSVTRAAVCVDRIAVMSPQPDSIFDGTIALPDRGPDLNTALLHACDDLDELGARIALFLPGDLPTLAADDICSMISAAAAAGAALAPNLSGEGTNAVALRMPCAFRFQFGGESLKKHIAEARRHGTEPAIVRTNGLGLDVDEPMDLELYRKRTGRNFP